MVKVENDENDGDGEQRWRDDAHDNHDDGDGMEMIVMMNE